MVIWGDLMAKIRIGVINYIDSCTREIINIYTSKLNLDINKINTDAIDKGIGRSSIMISLQDKNFYNSLNSLQEELIGSVNSIQKELSIKYREKELSKIKVIINVCYINYFNLYNNKRENLKKGLNSPNEDSFKNVTIQNIYNKTDREFERLKLNIKLKKDTPEIKNQKIYNVIAIIALVIATISAGISSIGVYLSNK